MGKGLLGPNGGSGRKFGGRFGEHCGGNGGIGSSMSEVGEGKVESMGGMGGSSLAIRSMESNDLDFLELCYHSLDKCPLLMGSYRLTLDLSIPIVLIAINSKLPSCILQKPSSPYSQHGHLPS
ncbi:hypothetical protein Tco_0948476 [Tanacetum coccineum]